MPMLVGCASAQQNFAEYDRRAGALLSQMTLDEKIGQMVQVDMNALKDKADIQKYFLGSMLSGGNSDPADNRAQTWLQAVNEYQSWALKTRLKIPLLYGIDAVHGHNNIDGAVIFPHNIGLGATHNPALVEQAEHITALEVAGTGIRWAFAPCIAVAQDERWGRTYESFGDSPELVSELGAAAVSGFQGKNFQIPPRCWLVPSISLVTVARRTALIKAMTSVMKRPSENYTFPPIRRPSRRESVPSWSLTAVGTEKR